MFLQLSQSLRSNNLKVATPLRSQHPNEDEHQAANDSSLCLIVYFLRHRLYQTARHICSLIAVLHNGAAGVCLSDIFSSAATAATAASATPPSPATVVIVHVNLQRKDRGAFFLQKGRKEDGESAR